MHKRFDPKFDVPKLVHRESGAMLSEWVLGYYAKSKTYVAIRYWEADGDSGWEYNNMDFNSIEDIDAPDHYHVCVEETKEVSSESERVPARKRNK